MATFKEIFDAGNATRDMLDDFVDEWHEGTGQPQFFEFLGYNTMDECGTMLRSEF